MQQQLDIEKLERQKDRAVFVAGAFADPKWKREANAAVEILCRLGADFTGDDVWRLLEGTGTKTEEPRALGAVIHQYAKDGRIFPTGEYRKSVRKESHRRPLAVWRPVAYKRKTNEAL